MKRRMAEILLETRKRKGGGGYEHAHLDHDIENICSLWTRAKRELKKKLKENYQVKTELKLVVAQLEVSEKGRRRLKRQIAELLTQLTEQKLALIDFEEHESQRQEREAALNEAKMTVNKLREKVSDLEVQNETLDSDLKKTKEAQAAAQLKQSRVQSVQAENIRLEKQATGLRKDCQRLLFLLSKTDKYADFVATNPDIGEPQGTTFLPAAATSDNHARDQGNQCAETVHWVPQKAAKLLTLFKEASPTIPGFCDILYAFLTQVNATYKARESEQAKGLKQLYEKKLKTQKRKAKHARDYRSVISTQRQAYLGSKLEGHQDKVKELVSTYLNVHPVQYCSGLRKEQVDVATLMEKCLCTIDRLCEKQGESK